MTIESKQVSASSLQVSLAAYRSLIDSYVERSRQAEAMTMLLMEQLPKQELLSNVVNRIHDDQLLNATYRSAAYFTGIQTTVIGLTELNKRLNDPDLVEIIKALTILINIERQEA